jgi:D-3-phosphoglycerate dehydrogenase
VKPLKVAYVEAQGDPVPAWVSEALEKGGVDLSIHPCTTGEALSRCAADADVVWVFGNPVITADRIGTLSRCGAILRTGSGTDNVPVEAATQYGIIVAHTPTAVYDEVADHTIGLLFAVIRQMVAHDRALRTGRWERREHIHRWHLRGSTLGLIGFGRIARSVARKMQGFSLQICACDPFLAPEVFEREGVRSVDMEGLLSGSDFVSMHTPLTKSTHHLISEAHLRLMKPESVLINTCRGPVVDEEALIRALREGWIAAAGLDVFEQEPLSPASPLLEMDNVVLTPHVAGCSDLSRDSFWRLSVETLICLAEGRWPEAIANPGVKSKWKLQP